MPQFRDEAVRAQRQSAEIFGDVVLASPYHHRLYAAAGALIGMTLVLLLVFGQYSRRITVAGQLLPDLGVVRLQAQYGGTVQAVQAEEGQHIAGGAVLLQVAHPQYDSTGSDTGTGVHDTISARRTAIEAELRATPVIQRHEADAQKIKLAGLAQAQTSLEQQVRLASERLQLTEEEVSKFARLKETGFVSATQLDARKKDVLDQSLALAALRKALLEAAAQHSTLARDLAALPLQQANARSTLFRSYQEVQHDLLENGARRASTVVAPLPGKVTALMAKPGSLVTPGQTVAALIPEGARLQAILYVPSHGVGFIAPGAAVYLRYRAFPYQKYGQATGTVLDVSATSIRPDELDNNVKVSELTAGIGEVPVYRVRVAIGSQQVAAGGRKIDLLAGALLDADIILDRKPLYRWIVDPVEKFSDSLHL